MLNGVPAGMVRTAAPGADWKRGVAAETARLSLNELIREFSVYCP